MGNTSECSSLPSSGFTPSSRNSVAFVSVEFLATPSQKNPVDGSIALSFVPKTSRYPSWNRPRGAICSKVNPRSFDSWCPSPTT